MPRLLSIVIVITAAILAVGVSSYPRLPFTVLITVRSC